TNTDRGHELSVADLGFLLVPGKPILPSKIFTIAIPPGAELGSVSFDTPLGIILTRTYRVPPAPVPRVIGQEDPVIYAEDRRTYERNFSSAYTSDNLYPQQVVELVRTAAYRSYNLVDVRVTPFSYRPLSGQLTYYPNVTVHLSCGLSREPIDEPVDKLPRTEKVAKGMIFNHDQAAKWHPELARTDGGLHDFVIITLDSLTSAVAPLVTWETSKGRTATVVTTSWISSTYDGYDVAEQIRNFLRDKYPSSAWGIEDVLLVGHYDDVPMRRAGIDVGYGQPATDFYYAELSLPDGQSWDSDGDHQYGEESDSVDLYSEVNVGRIPWSEPETVQSICERSVAYEQNDSPLFKKHMLLMGAYFWEDTDTAALMEAKIDHPWMADWSVTRLYEQNSAVWSSYECDYPLTHGNVMTVWPTGRYAFVNWAGHGLPTAARTLRVGPFIESSDCPLLNEYFPAVIFADACSNSDPDYENIGRAMLGSAAVGFVGATSPAYGCNQWDSAYDGCSQSLDYFFTTAVTSGEYTQGEALQWALREMYTNGLWYDVKYEMFEWAALLGNPNLRVAPLPPLKIVLPDAAPGHLEPDTSTTFRVMIVNGSEEYAPGAGLLHYRYEGSVFLTSPLVHDTENIFWATVPAVRCGAIVEFYVSAEGDGGSTVLEPLDAPNNVYAAAVGTFRTITHDDFDTDPGWSTEGEWAFGQPAGWGGEYGAPDPTGGYTGRYVYGYNLDGDYPNNLPETHLTSTAIDCTGWFNVHLKFWRWLGVEGKAYDHAYVRVSADGDQWTTVWENDGLTTDYSWTEIDLDISAVADDHPTVYLRWTMGETDAGWRCCGWNIDDVELRVFGCMGEPTCYDGMQNQGEGRIDCGGPCPLCDCASDNECDDGEFCSGVETCDAFGVCVRTVMMDCNGNDTEDSCDLDAGTSEDCNFNSIPDECDVGDGTSLDCQPNSVPDECDISGGASEDNNANGIPDECDPQALRQPATPHDTPKHRYLSIDPSTNPGVDTVIKVEVAEMRRCVVDPRRACLVDDDCDPVCVNDLDKYCISSEQCGGADCIATEPCRDMAPNYEPPLAWFVQEPQAQPDGEWTARLSDTVYSQDWSAHTVLHIGDCGIVPCVTYHVYACDPLNLDTCSEQLEIATQRFPSDTPFKLYADVTGGTAMPGPAVLPPDGYVNVSDLLVTLLTIQNYGGANTPQAHPTWVDLHGGGTGVPPNYILGVSDLQAVYVMSLTRGLPWVNSLGGLDPQGCP
ncbi:MAG: C25 family cysteine peptidase, partial [Planctomycetota bacterium]